MWTRVQKTTNKCKINEKAIIRLLESEGPEEGFEIRKEKMNGRQNMKRDSIRVLGWRRVLKENRKMKSTKKYDRHIYIYIYICVLKKELLHLLKIKILYKKNKPKIKKHRYMKYFGYILTFINHTVH